MNGERQHLRVIARIFHAAAILIPLAITLSGPAGAAETSIQELDAMRGEWQGSGWIQRGPERLTFASHEAVRYALDKTALLIEGRHFIERDGAQVPVHTALALIRPSREGDAEYSIHSYLSDGRDIEGWARWMDDEFQWGFALPDHSREVRYRVRIEGDKWTEVGETRATGQDWARFFEMHLKRQGTKD